MWVPRSSGVLLHPTSLPGGYGIGDLEAGYTLIDWLAAAGQRWWQVMPLNPTGYGDSPYQSFSAFAGNPYLIGLGSLLRGGLLTPQDLSEAQEQLPGRVDFGWLYGFKPKVLRLAHSRFQKSASPSQRERLARFQGSHGSWLPDFALFMAIKAAQGGKSWQDWPSQLRLRDPQALDAARSELAEAISATCFEQYLFSEQWSDLKAYARDRKIGVIGDLPIFVAMDSADAWAHPENFLLDPEGQPTAVAGVPPDYFSADGQLWGNPLYDWERARRSGYRWWTERFRSLLGLYDIIRVDHFRGFEAYWEVPAGAQTAAQGRWVPGPGRALFERVQAELGRLPIIAEDLGVITPGVAALRDALGFPGMAVLQFAFGGDPENPYLPPHIGPNRVVYTGTHDNDTTSGWYRGLGSSERAQLARYCPGVSLATASWSLVELAWRSAATLAIAPVQDLLDLGSEARMNTPGLLSPRNWSWRLEQTLSSALASRLRALTGASNRLDGGAA